MKRQKKRRNKRLAGSPCKTNDLGEKSVPNIDSHLNIGPRDIKLVEFMNNMETNHETAKTYQEKVRELLASPSPEDVHLFHEEKACDGAGSLTWEPSEPNSVTLLDASENRAPDESDLESVVTKKLAGNTKSQLMQRIEVSYATDESESEEEEEEEFLDVKEILKSYPGERRIENKKSQQFVYLESVLPDADVDYLAEVIELFGEDDKALESHIVEMMENKNYPKRDVLASERKRLWNLYVNSFDVKRFSVTLTNPENLAGTSGNDIEGYENLVMKFLQSRYPKEHPSHLKSVFKLHKNNLIKACEALSSIQPVKLSKSTFHKEAFDEAFLKQICYIDHREEIEKFLKEQKELKEIELVEARLNNLFISCPLCAEDELVASDVVACPDGDLLCKNCIYRYAVTKMAQGICQFPCPMEKCELFFTTDVLESVFPENVFKKLIRMQQMEEIRMANIEGLECCPFCEFSYIPDPENKVFQCQNCCVETCRLCREKSHVPLPCKKIERPQDEEARKKIEETMTETLVRACPTCGRKFVKLDGCNKISCVCGTIICYICRRKISGYDHFISGCPLHSRNEDLHEVEVVRSGIRVRNEILQENPNINININPTLDMQEFN